MKSLLKSKKSEYRPIRQSGHAANEEADAAGESVPFIVPSSASSASSDTAVGPDNHAAKEAPKQPGNACCRRSPVRKAIVVGGLLAIVGVSNLASLAVGSYIGWRAANTDSSLDRQCSAHTTHYSPLLDDVDIHYAPVHFDGSFMEENEYRRPGAPDVDAAWEALGVDYRAGVIPLEDGPRSGLTSEHVQRAEQYGAGYFVNVEGMHHLHCLNLVRKASYYNYPYYKELGTHEFTNGDDILQLHVSHCIDILRQVLMCNVDTGVLGQVWYKPDDPSPFPDFHTTHTCKNYEAVREWAEKLQAPPADTVPDDYLKPPQPDAIWPSTP
ncbi:hypothetical protein SPI_06361 [Niveomyces insectorum RCEF 264]|uniref:Tat pathway signal sequence n=1 Tax=Niveomyces insectorum RCEF 264 TaxID=1081102 RepID=A0A167S243_9HYPO|nr:hypothetical protein SPI_06361 [Niveomyces insectorum RCEF 264]